ncbi:MAG: ATP-binding protein [Candidatus Thermoplasmatota archaeon]|nr:ATP-binding protein [Euryarchaeota archaeon]MBU4072155.1 ATP-binding protein [Candidatus Thermoplasmatota archaeon]MBU4144634.1 ATP-binding protein [Candidatus Thermoplasmatota archaeon]MBU4592739.1 ATP-binding protein [Candidatus Thermoplasmatota archaeon]
MNLSRIIEYNPWWDTGQVRKELSPDYKRQMLAEILSSFESRYVSVLRGPRRTGKSTLLYQSIANLLSDDVEPESILYFSFDAEDGTIQNLLDEYRNSILGAPLESKKRIYVFLDEVQKCKGWAEQVKRNYDLYPNIKFVLSGSVSFELGTGTTESLAGRAREFVLLPMSFREYLELRGEDLPKAGSALKEYLLAERRLRPYFNHYLTTGGFPEIALEENQSAIKEYVLSSIVRRVVYGDLFENGRTGDPESMMALLRAISERPGILLNYDHLGSDIGRDRRTVSSYINRLEYTMIIRTLGNITGSALSSSRKHRKAYPVSSAMTYAFKGHDLAEEDLGRVYEIAVMNHLDAHYFWRRPRYEVDFITGDNAEIATEVKLSGEGRFHFGQYAEIRNLDKATVVTKGVSGKGKAGGIAFEKVPAWALCAGYSIL